MNARGMCRMHYMRWFHTGDARGSDMERTENGARCSVAGCELPNKGHRYCGTHYQRFKSHGDAGFISDQLGENNPGWSGERVGYYGMHKRTRQIRGSAKAHPCSHCDGKAEQWAYDHADSREVISVEGFPYSIDPMHYFPLCIPCHTIFDRKSNTNSA